MWILEITWSHCWWRWSDKLCLTFYHVHDISNKHINFDNNRSGSFGYYLFNISRQRRQKSDRQKRETYIFSSSRKHESSHSLNYNHYVWEVKIDWSLFRQNSPLKNSPTKLASLNNYKIWFSDVFCDNLYNEKNNDVNNTPKTSALRGYKSQGDADSTSVDNMDYI